MARSFLVLALIALLPAAFAEPTPPPVPPPNPPSQDDGRPKRDRDDRGRDSDRRGPADDDGPPSGFKKRLEQMSPEERQHFQENWKRWKEMNERERKDWQQRASDERERIKKVIDDAIAKLGLTLDQDQREVFVLRYRQERRKIEERICKEFNDKRTQEVDAMLQRLKGEFSGPKAPAAAKPSPTP